MNTPAQVKANESVVRIETQKVSLEGDLNIPEHPIGVVLFAHGSGSSRQSSRNRFVAEVLQRAGLATLLIDLLTRDEAWVDDQTRHLRFDIPLLANRLVGAVDWLAAAENTRALRIGCFGASTGAAAALIAATARPAKVGAVVSRGGRPDLAGEVLTRVQAPTLLIVGGNDPIVLQLNEEALAKLRSVKELEIVPGATHLFEQPGALKRVAELAAQWFRQYLGEMRPDFPSRRNEFKDH
jgi:putative phosphoribosyl transferase